MPRQPRMRRAAVCLLGWLVLAGCSSTPPVQVENSENLNKVAQAYREATQKLRHPPKNEAELRPFLEKHGDPDALLRSPNDGQPFVIIWGTDPNAERTLKPGVIGYEKQGTHGRRFVFTAMGVMVMGDDDFEEANFPKGHKP